MPLTKQEENIVRNWIHEIKNDRRTYPNGTPFQDVLSLIEKLLDTQWSAPSAQTEVFKSREKFTKSSRD